MDGLGFAAHRALKRTRGFIDGSLVRPVGSLGQPQIVLLREFGVDRQPNGAVARPRRNLHGVFHHFAVVARRDVAGVLVGRQCLLKQAAELHLRPCAARLDVGQHPLQVADAACELLHLAERLVDVLQLLADCFEALIQPGGQRRLQLFVHRLPHLLELLLIGGLQLCDRPGQHVGDAVQPLGQKSEQLVLLLADAIRKRRAAFLLLHRQLAAQAGQRVPQLAHDGVVVLPVAVQLIGQPPLQLLDPGLCLPVLAAALLPQQHNDEQHCVDQPQNGADIADPFHMASPSA